MGNVKFTYLYRDGANYKSWHDVVFDNPDQMPLDEIDSRLTASFLPDKLFIANQISIPEKFLFLESDATNFDHCYHEFDYVEVSEDTPTDVLNRSVTVFLKQVQLVSKQGWEAFDVIDRKQTKNYGN